MANHLGLDLHVVEGLAVVHANDAADHLRHDDHVAQMGAHSVGLLALVRRLLGLAQPEGRSGCWLLGKECGKAPEALHAWVPSAAS